MNHLIANKYFHHWKQYLKLSRYERGHNYPAGNRRKGNIFMKKSSWWCARSFAFCTTQVRVDLCRGYCEDMIAVEFSSVPSINSTIDSHSSFWKSMEFLVPTRLDTPTITAIFIRFFTWKILHCTKHWHLSMNRVHLKWRKKIFVCHIFCMFRLFTSLVKTENNC